MTVHVDDDYNALMVIKRSAVLYNKLVRLRSPYYMRPRHVNKTKDTARPQG